MSAPSPALEPTPNLRFADSLTPLDLCTFTPIGREESALTNTPVGGNPSPAIRSIHPARCLCLSVANRLPVVFQISTFDCRLWQIGPLFLVFDPFSISSRINTCKKTGGGGRGCVWKSRIVSFPEQALITQKGHCRTLASLVLGGVRQWRLRLDLDANWQLALYGYWEFDVLG